ncbi:hypothetical protein GOP47_0005998, partial [Adiantum capillus-veneris]
ESKAACDLLRATIVIKGPVKVCCDQQIGACNVICRSFIRVPWLVVQKATNLHYGHNKSSTE